MPSKPTRWTVEKTALERERQGERPTTAGLPANQRARVLSNRHRTEQCIDHVPDPGVQGNPRGAALLSFAGNPTFTLAALASNSAGRSEWLGNSHFDANRPREGVGSSGRSDPRGRSQTSHLGSIILITDE